MWSRIAIIGGVVAVAMLAGACGSGSPSPTPTATDTTGPVSDRYSGVLAASEFLVGKARFPFGLIDVNGQELRDAAVEVRFYSLNQAEPQLRDEATAHWREVSGVTPHDHQDGTVHDHLDVRGAYVVDEVTLGEPGIWGAEFVVTATTGAQPAVQGLAFEVVADSQVPLVGESVPPTQNLTIHDVQQFSDLSTRQTEDEMHEYSVAQALDLGTPFVVVFSSPMFCVSRVCGPVTDMAAAVHERHKARVNFIHIEPWDLDAVRNQGQLSRGPEMQEWGLLSEPWLFVIGADGKVATRFEGLVADEELERALQQVLAPA